MAKERVMIEPESHARLKPFVKLRQDKGRDRWVILAPERVLTPDDISVTVLQLCDGRKSVNAVAAELSESYDAPQDIIEKDIIAMLQDLADKGYVTDN